MVEGEAAVAKVSWEMRHSFQIDGINRQNLGASISIRAGSVSPVKIYLETNSSRFCFCSSFDDQFNEFEVLMDRRGGNNLREGGGSGFCCWPLG